MQQQDDDGRVGPSGREGGTADEEGVPQASDSRSGVGANGVGASGMAEKGIGDGGVGDGGVGHGRVGDGRVGDGGVGNRRSGPAGFVQARPAADRFPAPDFAPQRFVAIGDSFTEGVGDELADGSVRGWADLFAAVLSRSWATDAGPETAAGDDHIGGAEGNHRGRGAGGTRSAALSTGYANLAVRGKLLGQIIDDQLDPALALRPDLVTFAGGGNDILRPRANLSALLRLVDLAVARLVDSGSTVVMFTGPDPCDQLPLGQRIRANGSRLADGARTVAGRRGAALVDLWAVTELREPRFWAADRLHLNAAGHREAAGRVLDELGLARPDGWATGRDGGPVDYGRGFRDHLGFYREHVGPWVRRRLTGRSSGDQRPPKRPELRPVD